MNQSDNSSLTSLLTSIKQDSDLCVKCGRCLPVCPTYSISQNECESPRGRIALMEGIAKKELLFDQKLTNYLDHCLGCLACESVCPAQVPYRRLLDNTRTLQAAVNPNTRKHVWLRLLYAAVSKPRLLAFFARLLWLYQRLGLQFLSQKTGILKLLGLQTYDALLPKLTAYQSLQTYYPAMGTERGRVGLFSGCINNLVDQQTLHDSILVLQACGYGVYIPKAQSCCGALLRHAGQSKAADRLVTNNLIAFDRLKLDAILSPVSGCAAELQAYPGLKIKPMEVTQFLAEITWPANLQLKPLSQHVLLHTPCSMRYPLNAAKSPHTLLSRIPGITVIPLDNIQSCCGAAGAYLLEQPKISHKLLINALANAENHLSYAGANSIILATTNIGCALHLAKGFKNAGKQISIAHPITIVAKQLDLL